MRLALNRLLSRTNNQLKLVYSVKKTPASRVARNNRLERNQRFLTQERKYIMIKLAAGYHHISHERPLIEQDLDAYRMPAKLAEPTVCPDCSAVFHKGRWQWLEAPANANQETCPACKRIHDNFPAGYITLEGPYFDTHSEEILRTVQNHEQHERLEHPLKRIIATKRQGDTTVITTTDIHLARGIAEAVKHAFQGEPELHYNPGENLLRAYWMR
jgi:hypothetical protein